MDLKIFDVEHGQCALLEADNGARLMIDCGHNASNNWYPGAYLKDRGINALEMLAVTNLDEDHVSGLDDLLDEVDVKWLWRNNLLTPAHIKEMKKEHGMGPGVERFVDAIKNVFTGTGTNYPVFQGLERRAFCNSPGDFDDSNNLSTVYHLKCHNVGFMFPGDLETAGWLKLLEREDFQQALKQTHVLIASHHGRENGICEEIFAYTKPFYIVISDKGYAHETQETMAYYYGESRGGPFRSQGKRYVLTTRNDGRIGFAIAPNNWHAY
jgi:beta-lactamase superfamily II metal-dependent hydrolase